MPIHTDLELLYGQDGPEVTFTKSGLSEPTEPLRHPINLKSQLRKPLVSTGWCAVAGKDGEAMSHWQPHSPDDLLAAIQSKTTVETTVETPVEIPDRILALLKARPQHQLLHGSGPGSGLI